MEDRSLEIYRRLEIDGYRVFLTCYDAAIKYGVEISTNGARRLQLELPDGRLFWISVGGSRPVRVMVCHIEGALNVTRDAVLMATSRNEGLLAWSRFLTVEEVIAAVAVRDEAMAEMGCYDRTAELRRRVMSEGYLASKLRVDLLFAPVWKRLCFEVSGIAPEDVCARLFDQPDKMVVLSNDGRRAVIATREGQAMRKTVREVIMGEWGLAPEEWACLPPALTAIIEDAVSERLEQAADGD